MGANYDMLIARSVDQRGVIEAVTGFLTTKGRAVVRQAEFPEATRNDRLRSHTDNVVFIGPDRLSPWIPFTCVSTNVRISGQEWFGQNPLAVFVSMKLSPVVFLWTLDYGVAAG